MDKTVEVVNRQIQSMCSEVFEIGLFKPDPNKDAPEPEMFLRTWDKENLFRSIPWLRFQNMNGRNIFIRPKGAHQMTLIDDLKTDNIRALKAGGFHPALVVQTSPGNFQAWLNHGTVLPKDVSTAAARTLAEKFGGDTGAADWRHFGRLSGFCNRKEKYQQASGLFPFVRLMEANQIVYPKATEFVGEIRGKLERDRAAAEDRKQRIHSNDSHPTSRLKTIDDFRNNPMYSGDGNRIDLAFAVYAVSQGMNEADIRAAIGSRDLSHKGNVRRQEEYVNRTIQKAMETASRHGYCR
jgi:RepB DNA-primase from phage plasmid